MSRDEFNHIGDIYNRLDADARIQPVGDEAMNITSKDGLEKARAEVNAAIHERIVTAAELSRRTDIRPTAISQFRNNKWTGKKGVEVATASKLAQAVNQLRRQREADESAIGGFVRTSVAQAIYSMVQYVLKRRWIGVFVIPAGSGKTITLQQIAEDNPGSVLLTVTRTRASVKAFLQAWARAIGLDEYGTAQSIQDAIIARLVRSDRLVIIDEAHKLQVPCLDLIREVYDEAKVPIIMAGTPSFRKTLTTRRVGTVTSELMDQLYSRVGMFRDMSDLVTTERGDDQALHTRDDIRLVFGRGSVRLSRDGAEFLYRLANTPGSGALRKCRDIVQMVVDLHPGEVVTEKLLRAAHAMKVGERESDFQINAAMGRAPQEAQAVAATA